MELNTNQKIAHEMAPTINNGTSPTADKRTERPAEIKTDLICRIKYGNTLPDIPFDLKFLQYPFDTSRFVHYNPTSLERNYKYEVLTEHDLGVTIDLINRDLYQADPYARLHPADEKLLEEDAHTPHDSIRSKQHSRSVSWLRKSEYISTEQTRFQPQNLENIEAKVGYNVKKSLREETLYLDREAQVKAIEKTFEDSKSEVRKHYSKPNVVAIDVLPVFPDFKNWKFPCAQVIFDSDPAPAGKNIPSQMEEMSQAMIRGVMDESGEQFVAYFLPTETTLEKRREDFAQDLLYKDDEEYEYKIAREYNWNVKSKASKGYEENYFFVLRSDGLFYNELETRVRLNKRRMKVGQQPSNTKLVVKHRPLDASEHRMQRYRERQLEPHGDEEEEEEEMEINEATLEAIAATEKLQEEPIQNEAEQNASNIENEVERRSQSRSRSKSKSLARSRSGTASGSDRGSRSRSRSISGSRSRSHSGSRSRSHSRSYSRSLSRSHSGSHSRSRSGSTSRSASPASVASSNSKRKAHSRSPNTAKSRSRSKSATHSPSERLGSRSRSRSVSRSPSPSVQSRSPSPSRSDVNKSGTHSPSSRSGTRSRSRSYSRSRSGSRSPTKSPSKSPMRSRSRSRSLSPSVSGSPSPSASNSDED